MCMATSLSFKGYINPVKFNTLSDNVSVENVRENSFWSENRSFVTGTENSMGQKSIYNKKLDLKWYNKKIFKAILALVPYTSLISTASSHFKSSVPAL